MGKYHARFYRIEKVSQDKRQEEKLSQAIE